MITTEHTLKSFEDAIHNHSDLYPDETACRKMLILGMLSNAQEEIDLGLRIMSKESIDRVKIILNEIL